MARNVSKAKSTAGRTGAEGTYSAAELAASARRFGTKPECVAAALKAKGLQAATLAEAEKITKEFLKKEVI